MKIKKEQIENFLKQDSLRKCGVSDANTDTLVDGLIFEGEFHKFPKPSKAGDIRCPRCKGDNMTICWHEKGVKAAFCMNRSCLKTDSEISKEKNRRKGFSDLLNEQIAKEKKRAAREKEQPDFSWLNKDIDYLVKKMK